jgi:myo-inositol-1(or 4)-monophosphatase
MSDDLLALAMTAVQRSGEVLRGYFGRLKAGEVEEKAQNDWVSTADRASEEVAVEYLRSRTPEFGMLAEERGQRGDGGTRWVLDPLDGTANFVRGFPHFAVSLALLVDGRIELGVVYDPMRDELFTGRRGGGAYTAGRRLATTDRSGLAGAFLTTGFPFRIHRHLDTYLTLFHEIFLRAGAIRRPGAAALDLAHTAAGIFDGFFEFCLSPWDIAAGALLVREAGGVVSNLDGGDDIFTRGNVIAAAPAVHHELQEVIGAICRDDQITP